MQMQTTFHSSEMSQKMMALEAKVEKIYDAFEKQPLSYLDADRIYRRYTRHITRLLGGIYAPAYRDRSLRSLAYANFSKELREHFQVLNYKALLHSDLEEVIRFIDAFEFKGEIKQQINHKNGNSKQLELFS